MVCFLQLTIQKKAKQYQLLILFAEKEAIKYNFLLMNFNFERNYILF